MGSQCRLRPLLWMTPVCQREVVRTKNGLDGVAYHQGTT